MALITLKEYAQRHGRNPDTVRQKANRGTFETAVKLGRDWLIDEDEPYEDARIKTGDYINFKYGYQYHKQRKAIKAAQLAAQLAAEQAAEEQEETDSPEQIPDDAEEADRSSADQDKTE